ncbi:alpha-2-HS-glycoprotein-like [Hippocampus comes]|uniref:Alpha-2-HS-glycoprotein-like n=1 Tax=Hippocampus comes TaxID=109280 RepID=A0A3Q2XNR9_HIPCM|nr:PREDICTED: alpha-2-HS-glycoprotein-like [Hippocampus comes]
MVAHLLAVLLCCAAAVPGLLGAAVTCDAGDVTAAVNFAVHHINEHHKHGFKFKLLEVQSSTYEQGEGGCSIDINMNLMQSQCHVTNPKPEDQCEFMMQSERGAVATCNAKLYVMGVEARVISHNCITKPELTNAEMMADCPDCPTLLPLNDMTGVQAVREAVKKFNLESNHQNYFALMEISLLTSGYIPSVGMITWPKFVLVETVCPKHSRIVPEACSPRCPDRAHHVFCKTSYSHGTAQVGELQCELYLPRNTDPLPIGVQEPTCGSFHDSPEGAACTALLTTHEPAIHQICPFPLAVPLQQA